MMWLLYWPNRPFKPSFKNFFTIVVIIGLGFSTKAFSVEEKEEKVRYPGLLESLEKIIKSHKSQYKKLSSKIGTNPKLLSDLENVEEIKFDPYFLRSIIFHSNVQYLNLVGDKNCRLLSLLENDLLKTAEGRIKNVYVKVKMKNGTTESAIMDKANFLKIQYQKECIENIELGKLFNFNNLKATIKNINFPVPENEKQCSSVLDNWKRNNYLPYLCKIPNTIKNASHYQRLKSSQNLSLGQISEINNLIDDARRYRAALTQFHNIYLEGLCSNLGDPDQFCKNYLADDLWNKVANGEKPTYLSKYKCQNIFKRKKVSPQFLKACAKKLIEKKELCATHGSGNFIGLYPHQNCELSSRALNNSKLNTKYQDCPGRISNEAIINVHRIISHFQNLKYSSDTESCLSEATRNFAQMNMNFKNGNAWPLKICYDDPIKGENTCEMYIPGDNSNQDMSESQVIAQILARTKAASSDLKCEIVDSETFKPHLLEYKNGCFVVYNKENCTSLHCEKRIMYNNREVKNITYTGKPTFEYFPNSFDNEKFSMTNVMQESLKVKNKIIRNLTQLNRFLNDKEDGIIHGVGCAEDLVPRDFHRNSFNQCRPVTFIVDGEKKVNGKSYLVTRLSIEEVHSPRLISWHFVFNSLSNYRLIHPLNTWAFYGFYKN